MLDLVGHFAFILIAASYMVRDILWLRVISVVASVVGILYYYFGPADPLWLVIGWNGAFTAINTVHIGLLARERSGVQFNDVERELYETLFQSLAPFEFMKLIRIGQWSELRAGDVLIREGERSPGVMLLYNGAAVVRCDGEAVALLRDGDFIGEMSFATEQPASATVAAEVPCRVLLWPNDALRQLLNRNPSLRTPIQSLLSSDMANKLQRTPDTQETIDFSQLDGGVAGEDRGSTDAE